MLSQLYKKKYLIRHKILETLYQSQFKAFENVPPTEGVFISDYSISQKEISEKTGFDEKDLIPEIEILHDRKQISFETDDYENFYFITKQGSVNYHDKFYLEEGKKTLLTIVKDSLSIITTIGLFTIAIYTFITNISQTRDNTKDLELMKRHIDSLEFEVKKTKFEFK
ncbi:MAG: hypothetical protein Q7W45_00190 [Bacteroidota bacterium]|nr:hypothetical protein [Bacteroidota bacterium]MDP3146136.1 hypothetical protein [Bacteroidota bacterium]